MQTDDLVIHVQPPGGMWETLGVDRLAGIMPENFAASANEWGSDTASFDLRRNPGAIYPDLQAFTPTEVEIAGETVWSGRTLEAPTHDGADPLINVQAQGWQYHLDDDVFAKFYVHTNVNEWRDARSYPDAWLPNWTAAPTITTDNGAVLIQWPKSQAIINSTFSGVILDLGPTSTAAAISVDWDSSFNTPGANLYFRCAASPLAITAGPSSDALAGLANNTASSGTSRGTFATPGRYVAIFCFNGTGADVTPAADIYWRLRAIRVFASDAYRSTDASILHASDVVKDAAAYAPLLSSDTSQVAATTFAIPDLHFGGSPQTARETIQAANALHNYITKVDVDRRPVFQPRPTAPLYEIGAWGGADFEDASANSGDDVYNRAVVTGTGPDGTAMIVERYSSSLSAPITPNDVSIPNPSFDVGVNNWFISNSGSIGRVTSVFDTAPASGQINPVFAGETLTTPLTGTLYAGQTYTLTVRARGNVGGELLAFYLGDGSAAYLTPPAGIAQATMTTAFQTFTAKFTPNRNITTGRIYVYNYAANPNYYIDSMALTVASFLTIPSKQGFLRTKVLPVNAALTAAVAQQIGDVFLQAHSTQPLKGNVTVSPTGVRRVMGGDVHPAHLLRETGQRLRLSHRIDPDTGGQGRDGMIATVTYNHDARQAAVALDEDRRNFDVLLSRFAALSPAA